ncbi:sensor histidine kinase [Nocardia sp. CDC160]|uniref:sensor histidine kinase n=1 Tax=Nocardia sp. CDC160 TaxID=3112166 RepID=UPI002DBEFE0C|nr:histidine kinase [Nocardia sp. CDC160]MEC3916807.1 histidine kinase [Nocardia sp. CDC160]
MEYRGAVAWPVRRLAVGALCVVLALFWLLDLQSVWPLTSHRHHMADFVPMVSGPVMAALVLVPARSFPVVWRAGLGALGSWSVSIFLVFGHGVTGSWGAMESWALLALLVLTAWRAEPLRVAVGLCAVLGLAVIVAPLRQIGFGWWMEAEIIAFAAAVAAALTFGGYLRSLDVRRGRAIAQVRQTQRLELARDLHDFVAHHVTGIVVQAQAAQTIWRSQPEQVAGILAAIEKSGVETLDSMRRLVQVMREEESATVRPGELHADLADLVADFGRLGGVHATITVTDAARRAHLAPEVATSVHRVVQEALTNVRRHAASAEVVSVELDRCEDTLNVLVRNSSARERAIPVGGSGGLGLLGLRERVDAVGGSLTAGPMVGGGWNVLARFPILGPDRDPVAAPETGTGVARSDS